MKAWELAASVPWAMGPETLETLLQVAAGEGEGPEAVAARLGRPLENTRAVTVRDGVAVVPVTGPVFRRANLLTQVSGATSVEVLARDLREAMGNPAVRAVLLEVDSPGGEANGVGELAAMVHTMRAQKPIHAYVGGQGCSGAYWLAAACEQVVVAETAQLGSIGVVAVYRKERDGGSVEFVSSQSPHKRPDLETEEGRGQVQRVVDDIAAVFVRDVARYRKVAEEAVLSDFGGGGVLVGAAAVAAGLADRLRSFEGVLRELTTETLRHGEGTRRVLGRSKEGRMDGQVVEQAEVAAEVVAPAVVDVAELERMRERVTALEAREAVLLAAEARRQVGDALSAMRFGESGSMLAPASRNALVEALLPLEAESRAAVLQAVRSQQFVTLGEQGFSQPEEAAGETLTAAEEAQVRSMAERNGLPFEAVKEQFLAVRKRRAAA